MTPKLPALRDYQHSLPAPPPPSVTFDQARALRGRAVFNHHCGTCHIGGDGTDNNNGGKLHLPQDAVRATGRIP